MTFIYCMYNCNKVQTFVHCIIWLSSLHNIDKVFLGLNLKKREQFQQA